jgi:asparagine synthetase B (glutamine-hydrolysing)
MAKFTILKGSKLISKEEWNNKINLIESSIEYSKLIKDLVIAKHLIKEALADSIMLRSDKEFGVLLSGGLDSSLIALICKNLDKDFTCYSIGLEGSTDLWYANKVSSLLDLKIKTKILSLDEVEDYLKKCIKLLKTKDVVKLEIAVTMYAAFELASKDKCKLLFAGGGSEEIFAGYEKHIGFLKKGGFEEVYKESWNGLRSCYERDITRDYLISQKLKLNLLLPFLDINFIRTVMGIHPKLKLNFNEKKIILRDIALDLGLTKDIAYRKRTAAQYGSRISHAILKLSKKNGFKYKKDYINSL